MRKFVLIGYPLSHSFSPAYFAEKFAKERKADCSYQAVAIDSINKLPQLLKADPEIEGLNVTIPYKKEVIPFLHEMSEAVKKIGACNCIKIKSGRLIGYNTDEMGFEKSLAGKLNKTHTNALILGTGGSAAAVEFVLDKLGIDYLSVSRSKSEVSNCITYYDLTKELIRQHTLIINTTPVGMYPKEDACPKIPYEFLTSGHYLFDLIYNPGETLFLKKGAEQGATVKNGADMLIIQADESWKIWNEEI